MRSLLGCVPLTASSRAIDPASPCPLRVCGGRSTVRSSPTRGSAALGPRIGWTPRPLDPANDLTENGTASKELDDEPIQPVGGWASILIGQLGCYRYPAPDMLDYLDERMSVPPLDRIPDAFLDQGPPDPGVRALNAYDEFLAILNDSEKRKQLSALGVEDARESRLFTRIAELGKEFEAGLLTLLFDDPELRRWVRDYLIF